MSGNDEEMKRNEERKEYCLENIERGLKVVFENEEELSLFTSVIPNTIPNTTKKIDRDLQWDLEPELVIEYVFGLSGKGYERKTWTLCELIGLFEFFSALEMRSWELVVLNVIKNNKKLELAISLFKKTYEKYEQPSNRPQCLDDVSIGKGRNEDLEEEIQLKSTFTIALFNYLSKHIETIRKNRSWMRLFETVGVWGDLIRWKEKNLMREERFKGVICRPKETLVEFHMFVLHNRLEIFHNFIIVSADEKELPVHKEIIILFSDYFYQVIKFGGTETRREGYLILENLEHKEVKLLVEFIYEKSFDFKEEDLVPALNLLKELMAYPNEKNTQEDLKKSILEVTGNQIANETFLPIVLPEIGYMFHTERLTFPKETCEFFVEEWSEYDHIEKESLLKIIHKSLKEQEKKMEIEAMGEKFEQIDERFLKIEDDVKQIKSDVKEINSTLSEFAKELKRKRKKEDEDEIVPTRRSTRSSTRRRKIRRIDGDKDISS